jgi:nucleotide-binding universal stress UspA family protein
LEWATAKAEADGLPLVITHVEEPEAGLMGRDFARDDHRAGSELLAAASTSLSGRRGLDVSTALLSGFVAFALADAAEPEDLLVIGTHKTGFLHGRVLGSRSVQIATAAPCSVAVIPDTDLRHRSGVVSVLLDDDQGDVVDAAADEAARRGDELVVIRADGCAPQDQDGAGIAQSLRDSHPGLTVRIKETRRPIAVALLDASADKSLLVIGAGRSDPLGNPVGSVLHDVLLNLNGPVLVARR